MIVCFVVYLFGLLAKMIQKMFGFFRLQLFPSLVKFGHKYTKLLKTVLTLLINHYLSLFIRYCSVLMGSIIYL